MPLRLEAGPHFFGESPFQLEPVGELTGFGGLRLVLQVPPPGRLYGFGNVEAEIQEVSDDLHVGLYLGVGARGSADQDKLAIGGSVILACEDHYGVHGVADPVAGCQAVDVVGVEMPVGHAIVEQDSRPLHHHSRTEGALLAL